MDIVRKSMANSDNGTGKNKNYQGIAMVGELGPELHVTKDGNIKLDGLNGPAYTWVNSGDSIYTHE